MGTLKRFFTRMFSANTGKVTMAEAKRMAKSQSSKLQRPAPEGEESMVVQQLEPKGSDTVKKRRTHRKRRNSNKPSEYRDKLAKTKGTSSLGFREFGTFSKMRGFG